MVACNDAAFVSSATLAPTLEELEIVKCFASTLESSCTNLSPVDFSNPATRVFFTFSSAVSASSSIMYEVDNFYHIISAKVLHFRSSTFKACSQICFKFRSIDRIVECYCISSSTFKIHTVIEPLNCNQQNANSNNCSRENIRELSFSNEVKIRFRSLEIRNDSLESQSLLSSPFLAIIHSMTT